MQGRASAPPSHWSLDARVSVLRPWVPEAAPASHLSPGSPALRGQALLGWCQLRDRGYCTVYLRKRWGREGPQLTPCPSPGPSQPSPPSVSLLCSYRAPPKPLPDSLQPQCCWASTSTPWRRSSHKNGKVYGVHRGLRGQAMGCWPQEQPRAQRPFRTSASLSP